MAIFVSEGEEVASVNMVSPDCSDYFVMSTVTQLSVIFALFVRFNM